MDRWTDFIYQTGMHQILQPQEIRLDQPSAHPFIGFYTTSDKNIEENIKNYIILKCKILHDIGGHK